VVLEATTEDSEGLHFGHVAGLDHGSGPRTLYAHVGEMRVEPDNRVRTGQAIAEVGSTAAARLFPISWSFGRAKATAHLDVQVGKAPRRGKGASMWNWILSFIGEGGPYIDPNG
jgi:hypothetical protein